MKNSTYREWIGRRRAHVGALLLVLATVSTVSAAEPWNDYALRVWYGRTGGVTIGRQEPAGAADLDASTEVGVGLTLLMNESQDIELTLLSASSDRTAWDGTDVSQGSVDMQTDSLYATWKLRRSYLDGKLVPWIGLGVNAASIALRDLDAEGVEERTSSTAVGAHVSVGMDVYPVNSSAIAIGLQARSSTWSSRGDLKADLDGYSLLFGLKWDFGQSAF